MFEADGASAMPETPPYLVECATDQQGPRCIGGPDFLCAPGYTGTLCSLCENERFFWRGTPQRSFLWLHSDSLTTVCGYTAQLHINATV